MFQASLALGPHLFISLAVHGICRVPCSTISMNQFFPISLLHCPTVALVRILWEYEVVDDVRSLIYISETDVREEEG